jgi:tetratricopeptide (TPR) repeat protein
MAGWAISYLAGDHTTGLSLIERALVLNTNSALAWNARGYVLIFANRPDAAIESFERSMRLSPLDPIAYQFKGGLAVSHMRARRYHEAMEWVDQALQEQPRFAAAVRWKASLCGLLGRSKEGREWVQRAVELYPGLTITSLERFYAPINVSNLTAIFVEGIRKAGLPEE